MFHRTTISGNKPLTLAFGASCTAPKWTNTTATVAQLIAALTEHRVGPKDGAAMLQGATINGRRTKDSMAQLDILCLDVDDGTPGEELDALIAACGVFCIRYTTHSHSLTKHKNRLIFVPARPWIATDYASPTDAAEAWEVAYVRFASFVGVEFDASCTDTSRLFYLPRHADGAPYETKVHHAQ